MKKLVTILILLAVAGGGAYYYYSYGKTVEKPQVVKATVTQGDVTEYVQATGTLDAVRVVQVGPQVSGTIVDLFGTDFNSIVKEGQVVARLDPQLLQTQVDIQTANIERQETEIESQRVQLLDAQRTFTRTKELFEKGLANETQLEQAELTIKTREAQIASAEKSLVQARANLAQAKLNVSYTEVKSPIDGVVVNRRVDIGQTVQSSMNITPFFDIATDLRNLKLTAGVDESEIGKIRPGMEVLFTVDTYENTTFHGQVENVRLNATTTQNVVTYPVWINVPNPDLRLRPSLTATVRIILNTANNVMRVPNQAVRFRPSVDMYTALGLTPPAAPAGRAGGAGRDGRAAAGAAPATAGAQPPAAAAGQARPQGQQGQGQRQAAQPGGRTGGRGNFANMTPEQRQRMMANGGGRNGRGRGAGPVAAVAPPAPLDAQKIDELFAPMELRTQRLQVWTWDEASKALTEIPVVTGLNDGQFSQIISGDVKVGQEVITNIILPLTAAQRGAQQQSIFGQQQGRGFGGPQPGGGGNRGGGGRGGF